MAATASAAVAPVTATVAASAAGQAGAAVVALGAAATTDSVATVANDSVATAATVATAAVVAVDSVATVAATAAATDSVAATASAAGAPRARRIPYARQSIGEDDIAAVVETLRSDFLTTGPKPAEFEDALKAATGAGRAVALCNGTAALHAACFAAGLGPGDEAITSPMTFAASANCVLYQGARPVFCDIDPETWNMDPNILESLVTDRTKAIIPVHYAGLPCDMDAIMEIAGRRGLAVIEDAAHAIGATYGGRPIGSIGRMTCFSFHPVKQITSGEGGAVTTDDEALYRRLLQFRSHGITRDAGEMAFAPQARPPWYYEQQFLGYNYRLSDIHAALGVSQLKKLGAFLARRRQIAAAYRSAFSGLCASGAMALQRVPEKAGHAWHLFVARLDAGRRDAVFDALLARGVGANLHYIPVYLHPHYRRLGYPAGLCPAAERLYAGLVTLPLFPGMSDADADYVIKCVLECVGAHA